VNGEDTYVIIDLWSRIGELGELSWGWAHAQLTGVFRQRNLSALVHHQVGSSKFNTSSSSGYIQQLLREVGYSPSQRVFTVTPYHRSQRQSNSFSYLQGSKLLHVTSIHSGAPPSPFPQKKGRLVWVSSKISSVLPFSRGTNLHGRIDLRRHSRFGLEAAFTFWASLPLFLLHAASIIIRGVV